MKRFTFFRILKFNIKITNIYIIIFLNEQRYAKCLDSRHEKLIIITKIIILE